MVGEVPFSLRLARTPELPRVSASARHRRPFSHSPAPSLLSSCVLFLCGWGVDQAPLVSRLLLGASREGNLHSDFMLRQTRRQT